MKYKHGQKVTCKIRGKEVKDAKISINKDGEIYICQNINCCANADDKLGYKYSRCIGDGSEETLREYYGVTDLKPALKSFDDPQVGDEYKDGYGRSRFVLGVSGRVIHMSSLFDKDKVDVGSTKEELIKHGFTIVQDEPEEEVTEMTAEEVCKALEKMRKYARHWERP